MPADSADLSTLSRLLDDALELEPAQVEVWLEGLPERHRHLLPKLREMLAEHLSQGKAGFMADGPKLADDSFARAGDLVGPYRLIREIGHGGMGAVWLAERADGSLKRQVAVKLPRLAWGAGLAERMARERDIGALLEHPHIARLYDAGVDALGRPYLALEYIDGRPLDEWCEAKALTVAERLCLFQQVARAVAYAHGRLVVHRDLKPSNVLVTPDGETHLLDFGIAKLLHEASPGDQQLTQEQGRVLTPHYASPEQIRGEAITVQSDVYSLGVLLYQLLTRQLPYSERRSLAALEEAILRDEPPPASSRVQDKHTARQLRGELDAILAKALRREPGQRYATADALAEDIERYLSGGSVLAQPDSLHYRLTKSIKRHRVGYAAGSAVLLAVLGGAGVALVQARRANEAAAQARVVKDFVVDVFRINERGSSPSNEGSRLPAELILERGAKLIETKFPGQPALQAELYGVIGEVFANMGANELAAEYAARQVEALRTIGASPSEQALAGILLARTLLAKDQVHEADIEARRVLQLAGSDPALRRAALVLLARVLLEQGAVEDAERLLALADSSTERASGASVTGARSKFLRAQMLNMANRFDEAVPVYVSAVEEAQEAEGPMSPLAIDIRFELATALLWHGRFEESRMYRSAALATLRDTGGASEVRAAIEEVRFAVASFNYGEISFEETKATIERSRSLLAARGSAVSAMFNARLGFRLGEAYLGYGQIDKADRLISASAAIASPRVQSMITAYYIALVKGRLAMFAGRHDQANASLTLALSIIRRLGRETHPYAALNYAEVALNLGMQGRFDEAEAVLASAPSFAALKGAASGDRNFSQLVPRARARVKLMRGDAVSALALLPPEGADSERQFPLDDRLLRGEILCAAGRRGEGLPLLEQSLAWHANFNYEHHPELARARAVTGLCALADGQTKRAAELAALARASFVAQPAVSPYFKAASAQLDRQLLQVTAKR